MCVQKIGLKAGAVITLVTLLFSGLVLPLNVASAATLFSDGFEAPPGIGSWVAGVAWSSSSSAHSGSKSAHVNGGNSAQTMWKTISTSGQNNIVVSFWYKADDLESSSNDVVNVQWWNGSATTTFFTISDSNDDNIWHQSTTTISGASNLSNFKIIFNGDLDSGNDKVWIDDVSITGDQINHALTVTKTGNGSGTVTSVPAGISCAGDCTESYTQGTSVTLTAAPTVGSTFAGWSGGVCSGTGSCVVSMTAAKSVTATFTLNTYTLGVVLAGNGSGSVTSSPIGITCPVDCSETYNHGTSVTLTATPDILSTFAGWGGDCSGTGACVVTMDAAKSVTASFITTPVCPPGWSGIFPTCVPPIPSCPTGTHGVFPACIPDIPECPGGIYVPGIGCITIPTSCPSGTTGIFPLCIPIEPEAAPYCGDASVNQAWEQCDGGANCTAWCQNVSNQCTEDIFARVNVTAVQNWTTGNASSSIFLGQSVNSIPQGTWFPVKLAGTVIVDPAINGYENVPGLAVERSSDGIRVRNYGHLSNGGKEHVEGSLEFSNATATAQVNDGSGNQYEDPTNSTKTLSAGEDEYWISEGKSYFWTTVTSADDGFLTTYTAPICDEEPIQCPSDQHLEGGQCVPDAPVCTPNLNLIQNGGFEAPAVAPGGWSIIPFTNPVLKWLGNIIPGSNTPGQTGLELQASVAGAPNSGNQHAELDGDHPTNIYQDIVTIPGKEYKLSYFFSPRPNTPASENQLEVSVNNALVGNHTGAGATTTSWQEYTYTFTAASNMTQVAFKELGPDDNGNTGGLGSYLDDVSLSCVGDPTPKAKIVATKVVCDNESDLPNWSGSNTAIDANTANNYVIAHPNCHLVSDWEFQWAPTTSSGESGSFLGAITGGGWTTFGPTNGSGVAEVTVPMSSVISGQVWVREVLKSGFIPFTYPGDNNNVSAEMWCNGDVLNYDNLDYARNLSNGVTVHCVSFNAPKDMCPNMQGTQTTIPDGNTLNNDGECVPIPSPTDTIPPVSAFGNTLPHAQVTDEENFPVTLSGSTTDNMSGVASANLHIVQMASSSIIGSEQFGSVWEGAQCPSVGEGALTPINTEIVALSLVGAGTLEATWVYDWTPTSLGIYCFEVHATDVAGNVENTGHAGPVAIHVLPTTSTPPGNPTPPNNQPSGGNGPPMQLSFGGGAVLGTSTSPMMCSTEYLTSYMGLGKKNDPEQVKKLQIFLNEFQGANLPVTGFFGPLTHEAVKKFQVSQAEQILGPWVNAKLMDQMLPTGYVYKTTKRWINMIKCAELKLPVPQLP